MTKLRKSWNWIGLHEKEIFFIIAALILFLDIYLIIRYFLQKETTTITIIIRIMAVVNTLLYAVAGTLLLKKIKFKKFLDSIAEEMDKAYFHGFKFQRYLETDAILRFEGWLGSGLCYELSALAMILAKNQESAKLCRGDYYDKDGNFKTRHSWVEVKVPLNGWFIIDFAWMSKICKKSWYFHHRKGKLVQKWICSYEDFWGIQFPNIIWEAIHNQKTSYVLMELSAFGGPDIKYNFRDWIYTANDLRFSDGDIMYPHCRDGSDKPISNKIIRDFIKNPKRKSPKAKSIRTAKMFIRKYELWKAKNYQNAPL
ncbi:hypothetical protein IKF88_00435 [Candidatus Saccharibacteria bacterium]|nr:hypothetical protein [Candidatus Saccharibacteria bacterium]